MIKRKKQLQVLFLLFLCVFVVMGCSKKMTPKKLMGEVAENLSVTKSVSNSLKMEVELESVLDTMKITMDMDMQSTTNPQAGHANGTAAVDMNGTLVESGIEIYQVEQDGKFVTYSSIYDAWTKETADSAESEEKAFSSNLFQEAGNSIKTFTIAKESVEVDGKSCYEMYGDISGEELLQFMGLDMMQVFGMVQLPDENAIKEAAIPVTIDVYEEELLPARVLVDMTDVMNNLYDKYGEATNVNDFTIQLGYTGYDEVEAIVVPADVVSSVQE